MFLNFQSLPGFRFLPNQGWIVTVRVARERASRINS